MAHERSSQRLLRHACSTCGMNEIVVKAPAIKPSKEVRRMYYSLDCLVRPLCVLAPVRLKLLYLRSENYFPSSAYCEIFLANAFREIRCRKRPHSSLLLLPHSCSTLLLVQTCFT